MFGPGLEMSTSPIVRKIIQDKTGLFKATGMFPGKFDGEYGYCFAYTLSSAATVQQ